MNISTQYSPHKGFSLIELMVVIAIVAILATVAVPAYNNYMISARLATIVPVIDGLVQQSIIFSQTNGRFGSAYDLGYGSDPTPEQGSGFGWATLADNITALSPYFTSYLLLGDFNNSSSNYPTPCGREGTIGGNLDTVALGFDQSLVNFGAYQCDYWNYNEIITTKCFYFFGCENSSSCGGLTSQNGIFMPGWINYNAPADGPWQQTNFDTMSPYENPSILTECQ